MEDEGEWEREEEVVFGDFLFLNVGPTVSEINIYQVPKGISVLSNSLLAKMNHFYCSLARMSLFIVFWPI